MPQTLKIRHLYAAHRERDAMDRRETDAGLSGLEFSWTRVIRELPPPHSSDYGG